MLELLFINGQREKVWVIVTQLELANCHENRRQDLQIARQPKSQQEEGKHGCRTKNGTTQDER